MLMQEVTVEFKLEQVREGGQVKVVEYVGRVYMSRLIANRCELGHMLSNPVETIHDDGPTLMQLLKVLPFPDSIQRT